MYPVVGPVGHASPAVSLPLTVVLLVAGLGTSLVVGLALAAFARRRSRPYLLVTLAIAALLARTVVAGFSLQGILDAGTHHFAEHALDVAMVALVIAAVYTARTRPVSNSPEQ